MSKDVSAPVTGGSGAMSPIGDAAADGALGSAFLEQMDQIKSTL